METKITTVDGTSLHALSHRMVPEIRGAASRMHPAGLRAMGLFIDRAFQTQVMIESRGVAVDGAEGAVGKAHELFKQAGNSLWRSVLPVVDQRGQIILVLRRQRLVPIVGESNFQRTVSLRCGEKKAKAL